MPYERAMVARLLGHPGKCIKLNTEEAIERCVRLRTVFELAKDGRFAR